MFHKARKKGGQSSHFDTHWLHQNLEAMDKIRGLGFDPTNVVPERSMHHAFNRIHFVVRNPIHLAFRINQPSPRLRRRRWHSRWWPNNTSDAINLVSLPMYNLHPPVTLVPKVTWHVVAPSIMNQSRFPVGGNNSVSLLSGISFFVL